MAGNQIKMPPYVVDHSSIDGIKDPTQAEQVLDQLAHSGARALLKIGNIEQQFFALLSEHESNKHLFAIKLAEMGDNTQMEAYLQELVNHFIFFYRDGEILISTRCRFLRAAGGLFWFQYMLPIFEIRRRKHPRFYISEEYEVFINIDSKQKRLLDISTNGLAFQIATLEEAAFYKLGSIFTNIQFKIKDHFFAVDGLIRNHYSIGDAAVPRGAKIGVEFLNLSADDMNWIRKFVLLHVGQMVFY